MADIFGEYSTRCPTHTLMIKRGNQIPNDVARLVGSRFVIATESESQTRLSETLVKQLTGGDTVAARFLHREYFEFRPQFKLFLGTNHKPTIRGQDHAIWRRIKLVPFTVTIPDEEQDKELGEKLRAEVPGILHWAVQGCLEWQKKGLVEPTDVTRATAEYREEMDVLGDFFHQKCIEGPSESVKSKDLYAAYKTWCEESGERFNSQKRLGSRLRERGFYKRESNGKVIWEKGCIFCSVVGDADS